MTEQVLFRGLQTPRVTTPFRERMALAEAHECFGPDPNGFAVYVSPSAKAALIGGTRRSAPKEVFGWLRGRAFRDQLGPYTVVDGVIYADRLDAGLGHVRLSEREMADLRCRAARAFPMLDDVGWTHAHHRPSGYSETDRAEQSTWPAETDVGILTFMQPGDNGRTWAVAYAGPHATLLEPAGPGTEDRDTKLSARARGDTSDPALFQPGEDRATASPAPGPIGRRWSPRRRHWLATGAVFAAAAVTAIAVAAVRFDHRLHSLDTRVGQVDARLDDTDFEQRLQQMEGRLDTLDARVAHVAPSPTPTATTVCPFRGPLSAGC